MSHSIVVNKRYYDFDYDNNAIIMFDAEDLDAEDVDEADSNPMDWDVFSEDEDAKSDTKSTKGKDSTPSADTLSSAASSPDTVEGDPSDKTNKIDSDKAVEGVTSSPYRIGRKRKNSRVTWISSDSGSARRIPFALQVAHSYTIKKLEMQHYQLVDTATVKKQEAARQQAKLAQLKMQHYQYYNAHPVPAPYAGQQYAAQYHHGGGQPHGHYPPQHAPQGPQGHYRYPANNMASRGAHGQMRPSHGPPHGPPRGAPHGPAHGAPHGAQPNQQVHGSHAPPGPQAPRMRYMPPQHPRKQDGSEYVTYRAPPRTTASPQK